MKIFISSTYKDLVVERRAAMEVIEPPQWSGIAMERFPSEPDYPLHVALKHLSESDAVILIVGFKAGSAIPEADGLTYTGAEVEETRKLRKKLFTFIRTEAGVLRN